MKGETKLIYIYPNNFVLDIVLMSSSVFMVTAKYCTKFEGCIEKKVLWRFQGEWELINSCKFA